MLKKRLLSATIVISLLTLVCWFDAQAARQGIFLAPLAIAFCVLATGEMLRLYRTMGHAPLAWVVYLGTLLPVLASCVPIFWLEYPADCPVGRLGWLGCGLAGGMMLALLGTMWQYSRSEQLASGTTTVNLGLTALSVLYVGGLIGFIVQLRQFPGADGVPIGLFPLLSLIFIVKVSDSGQYFVGKNFGKRKLAPRLSPGKTWEGTIGGIGITALLSATLLTLYMPEMEGFGGWLRLLVFCVLLSAIGLLGDLAESLLKRDAGVKDSSDWLPGLGGVLDMLDSLLWTAPVAYLCWAAGLVGG